MPGSDRKPTKVECQNPLQLDKKDVFVDNGKKTKHNGYAKRYNSL